MTSLHLTSWREVGEAVMIRQVEEILENVGGLIGHLDDFALKEVQDLPFLEMTKYVSIKN